MIGLFEPAQACSEQVRLASSALPAPWKLPIVGNNPITAVYCQAIIHRYKHGRDDEREFFLLQDHIADKLSFLRIKLWIAE